jgi:hypothetical protein
MCSMLELLKSAELMVQNEFMTLEFNKKGNASLC